MTDKYLPAVIEPAWRARWQADGLDRTPEDRTQPKFYCLDFFPYPSGDGLSVGHCRNYVPTDVISRYRRMRGDAVLHPMGWDAFGLPAENEAILKGQHPRLTVPRYAANYRRQLTLVGCSYDWEREIDSSAPEYYHWTQWFFLYLYRRGLAYRASAPVNWCPKDGTVLANEEVEDGRCWRCGTPIERRDLPQWFFRITAYAERLLDGLGHIDWPESILRMQRHWIGRGEGVEFDLPVEATERSLRVFTTRAETIGGMTFAVLAPEHPLVEAITTPERRAEVMAYVAQARRRTEVDRLAIGGEQRGVCTGAHVRHPLSGALLPVYVAGYVLAGHGSGAIMAVPAHDERDHALARHHGLPVVPVIRPVEVSGSRFQGSGPYIGDGELINSGELDGLPSEEARERLTRRLVETAGGQRRVVFRMRDWLISRQRYWGAPIPILYCRSCGEVPVPEADLPVRLPEIEQYQPSGDGRSPLARVADWVQTTCPRCGGAAERETDTMGGFACSSWYFLRFASPHEPERPFDPEAVRYWLPVDLYVGGAEHAVLHLLYARFWTKVMYDGDLIAFDEPFLQLRNQGIVHAADGRRMSKSRGNVVTPDSVVERYGADALRTYLLFLAPFDQNVTWSDEGIRGLSRWLGRVWGLVVGEAPKRTGAKKQEAEKQASEALLPANGAADAELDRTVRRALQQTIRRVTENLEGFRFNTMIAALMGFTTVLGQARASGRLDTAVLREAQEGLVKLLAPSAPYLAEELWARLGHTSSVHREKWPGYDAVLASEEQVTLVVQVNGRLRERLTVPAGLPESEALQRALASPRVAAHLNGRQIRRAIYRQGQVLNLIVS